jgi:hypothetical protein
VYKGLARDDIMGRCHICGIYRDVTASPLLMCQSMKVSLPPKNMGSVGSKCMTSHCRRLSTLLVFFIEDYNLH